MSEFFESKCRDLCKKYNPSILDDVTEEDFLYIAGWINQAESLYSLALLRPIVPMGMLKFRLQEKIKVLQNL